MSTGIAILATGSELLDGRVTDTNSTYIAARLTDHGLRLDQIVSCGDDRESIKRSLRYLCQHSSCTVIMGGLGPTTDDLTREAVAELLNEKLVLNDQVLADLKALYQKRKREFDPTNIKQATFPESAAVIENKHGTAAAFSVKHGHTLLIALPGVPHELRALFDEQVLPRILAQYQNAKPLEQRLLRVFGLPESMVGARVESARLDPAITVSYRAIFPEIHVVLKTSAGAADLEAAAQKARAAIGEDFVFSNCSDQPLERVVRDLLLDRKLTLSVAESCTAGMLGALLTRTPGSSAYFMGGAITYSNWAKTDIVGVAPELLEKYGAVSGEVAKAMAVGAQKYWHSTHALSITGVAGPDGGTAEKPVGLFYLGFAAPGIVESYPYFFTSSREWVRTFATYSALDLLRRSLLGLPIRSVLGKVPQ